jgi:hypothetical protein
MFLFIERQPRESNASARSTCKTSAVSKHNTPEDKMYADNRCSS